MGFFSKSDKEFVLVFDVGNGSVGVAVAEVFSEKNGEGKAQLKEIYRESIPFQEHLRFDRFMNTASRAVEAAARKVKGELKYPVKKAYLILASPWYASQTRVVNLKKKESFVFTEEMFETLISRESESFRKEYIDEKASKTKPENNLSLIEQHVVQLKCNGYEIEDPFGKKVKTVEMPLYLSVAPQIVLDSFGGAVRTIFPDIKINFGTFPLAYFFAAREIYPKFDDALLVDVSGEVTDIAFVWNGALLEIASFPIGRNTIFRRLSSVLHRPAEEIISLFSIANKEGVSKDVNKKIESALEKVVESWTVSFEKALAKLADTFYLPDEVFLTADGDMKKWLTGGIKKESFSQYVMTHTPFSVTDMGDLFERHGKHLFGNNKIDTFIGIGVLYIMHNKGRKLSD